MHFLNSSEGRIGFIIEIKLCDSVYIKCTYLYIYMDKDMKGYHMNVCMLGIQIYIDMWCYLPYDTDIQIRILIIKYILLFLT